MYSFLFNQTYISVFVIALLVFLLMFLWRKLTILEGNYFLLEKRVNIIKKEDRSEQLSKNLEKSDAIMKEVFKNNIKRGNCDNNDTVCNIPKNTDEEDYIMDDIENNIDITIIDVSEEEPVKIGEGVDGEEDNESGESEEEELVSHIEDITKTNETSNIELADNNDNVSITSDITFNNEDDKILSKKYKAMNLEKLREECKIYSLNSEGTKSILISRIIDNIKKQK
tara:strand:- start:3138 stop:3815 length:678 start_codon:yes stop_codon:yes gene_type:complete